LDILLSQFLCKAVFGVELL